MPEGGLEALTRKRGRPLVDDTQASVRVNVNLPAGQYDELYAAARRAGVSVPEAIRMYLQRARRRPTDDDDDDPE